MADTPDDIVKKSMKGKTKPRSKQTQINQSQNKVAVAGNVENINISENNRYHEDDSAIRQGRSKIGVRHYGDKVETQYMTPKEYRNFRAATWDGVERRDGVYNWTPYTWPNATEDEVDAHATQPEDTERRHLPDRRQKAVAVEDDRRHAPRRSDEIADQITHIITVIFCIAVYAGLWWIAQ